MENKKLLEGSIFENLVLGRIRPDSDISSDGPNLFHVSSFIVVSYIIGSKKNVRQEFLNYIVELSSGRGPDEIF